MMASRAPEYTVRVCRKEMVATALPMQEHRLPLSNLDLLVPPMDVGVFFCYTKPPPFPVAARAGKQQGYPATAATFAALVTNLKASLAKTLVSYYPFTGEVVANAIGEPELLCNNRGVEFIEAYGDVELADLDFHDADQSLEKKLVPKKHDGVLSLQATEMKCGGMVLGCSFDHRVADAYSFNMFLVAWTETAAAKPISIRPSFCRSLLSPSRPVNLGSYLEASLERIFVPVPAVSQLPPPDSPASVITDTINRICYIAAEDIDRLQVMASASGRRRTKLESFTAYLWKLIGRAGKADTGGDPTRSDCHMGVVVDGRLRLGTEMEAYFGNVLSIPYATLGVEEVEGMGIEELAEVVHEFVTAAAREEHFRGLVDLVEARRPEVLLAKVCIEEGLSVVVSSGRGFPVGEVEFGWGKAMLGSYHFPWQMSAGYVMPMPSNKRNGDWVVYLHLSRKLMEVVDADGTSVFRPLTADYLLSK